MLGRKTASPVRGSKSRGGAQGMVEGRRKKVKYSSKAKQLSRSVLAEKGERVRAREFKACSACGV